MTLDVLRASAGGIASAVASGEVSAHAVTDAALAQIAVRNSELNAFTDITRTRALAEAAALDSENKPRALAGVPFAVKNLYDIKGLVTRAGSKINRDNPPADADAFVVGKLAAAGAVLLGALDMDEYAYGFTGENIHDGNSLNPHDPRHMTGGSSGGSAAAVASGMAVFALGSDTNGSVRVPASLCGLFGLKPTYGRLSRRGVFPFVASFDHVGVLARSAADAALVYDVMQGWDMADPAQAPRPLEPVALLLDQRAASLRVAVAGDYFRRGGRPECFAAVDEVAAALGATREIILPEAAAARAAAFVITAAEGAAFHLSRLKQRSQDFDAAVRDRLFAGAMIPAAAILQAQKLRAWFRDRVNALFENVDLILAPATPCRAPLSGQKMLEIDGAEVPVRANLGIYTQPISFIGLPAMTVPLWTRGERLPIGVQIIGAPWREDLVLRAAHELEKKGIARALVS